MTTIIERIDALRNELDVDQATFRRALARTREIVARFQRSANAAAEQLRTELALAYAELGRACDVDPIDDGPHLDEPDVCPRCGYRCDGVACAETDAQFADRLEREAHQDVDEALAPHREISADEDAAMSALHGGHPDDPEYCST